MSTNPITLVMTGAKPRRELLWLKDGKLCHWCRRPTRLTKQEARDQATIDHIVPRYKGGTNDLSNVVSACRECNARRNSEDMKGLPEGHLLGKHTLNLKSTQPSSLKHIALTKDDKKALMQRATQIDMLTQQREAALREIVTLRNEVGVLQSDAHLQRIILKDSAAEIDALKKTIAEMTVMSVIRRKLGNWLLTPHGK